jgi:hypothetical protein
MDMVLSYVGAAAAAVWGIVHLIPTGKVAAGFGAISGDNRKIITMEWIAEGAFLIFIGTIVILATSVDHSGDVSRTAYAVSAAALIGLAIVSLFTGFKVKYLPFRLCPVIFTASAVLILTGAYT